MGLKIPKDDMNNRDLIIAEVENNGLIEQAQESLGSCDELLSLLELIAAKKHYKV